MLKLIYWADIQSELVDKNHVHSCKQWYPITAIPALSSGEAVEILAQLRAEFPEMEFKARDYKHVFGPFGYLVGRIAKERN